MGIDVNFDLNEAVAAGMELHYYEEVLDGTKFTGYAAEVGDGTRRDVSIFEDEHGTKIGAIRANHWGTARKPLLEFLDANSIDHWDT